MSEELVRVQHPDSDDFEFVPRSQVPPHYCQVYMQEYGVCWVSPGWVNVTDAPRHGPFPEPARDELRRFMRAFEGMTDTLEKWESDFRRDRTPWREMAIWDSWAAVVERFTAHLSGDDDVTKAKREDVGNLVLELGTRPTPPGAKLGSYASLTANRVREIHAAVLESGKELYVRLPKYRRLLRPLILATPFPAEASVHVLMDDNNGFNLSSPFDSREFLGTADVVYAQDEETGARSLVYGQEVAARVEAGEPAGDYRIVTVTLDTSGEEMTWLAEAIKLVKG